MRLPDSKTVSKMIIIGIFLSLICLPHLLWQVIGDSLDSDNYENAAPVAQPVFDIGFIDSYPSSLEQYYNSQLPFRNQLIKLYGGLQYNLFHSSMDPQVIPGREGWLFYNSKVPGETMGSYTGRDLFSEEELSLIASNLESARKQLEEQNCQFVLFIAPDKERVYPEYMPGYIRGPAEIHRTAQLMDYLSQHTKVRVVYPLDELLEAKKDYQVYYRLDSHWNHFGGYVGSNALLSNIGCPLMDISDTQREVIGPTICDLANLLNLGGELNTDPDTLITGFGQGELTEISRDAAGLYVYENPGAPLGTLFMVRDSFADSMDRFLAGTFRYSYLPHSVCYTSEQLAEVNPDIFVLELVERRLDSLKEFDINTALPK